MRIIPISLPTPFYVGPVNVYLIQEEPLTLIDTGPKTKEALEALKEGLRKERVRVSDIKRIVLTHAHEDHCGLAKQLRDEAKDAQVFVHGWETGHRKGRLEYGESRALLERAGVPAGEIAEMRRMYEGVRRFADALEDHEHAELFDDDEIKFERGSLRVVHTPGHTPGSCSFLREADRTAIAVELFPGADDIHRFLAVSEAVAHLDLAHSENKLALELSAEGREVYRKA